ncbi:MAG: hypothetical protein LAT51_10235 [Flavobacteriaceae bacterium]|nr:hypothetical protein [Flavobacteriaceae bacterium]
MTKEKKFSIYYSELVTEFREDLNPENFDRIPEPFLPLYGEEYFNSEIKIMIVGIETRKWGDMSEFINEANINPETTIFRNFKSFRNLDFLKWGNNFGRSFWDFNLKFLANFHEIDNWKTIKKSQRNDIAKSFVWGNYNSLEDFKVTAKKKGAKFTDWQIVKEKSKIFDSSKHLLEVFEPNIILVLNWGMEDSWLRESDDTLKKEVIGKYLIYYYLPKYNTHLIKTAHPTSLSNNRNIDYDKFNKKITQILKEKMAIAINE